VVAEEDALKLIGEPDTVYLASLNCNVDAANAVACAKLKSPEEEVIKLKSDDSTKARTEKDRPPVDAFLERYKDTPDQTGGVRGEIRVGAFILSLVIQYL